MKINLENLNHLYPQGLYPSLPRDNAKLSSVIIPLFKSSKEEFTLILTKRNENLKNHPGQISFPGGVKSESESLLETAFREWEEEIGESRDHLNVCGSFGEFNTFTGYVIVPFIAIYSGNFSFKPNPDEVDRIILLDLKLFNENPFYEVHHPKYPGRCIYYLQLNEELLWGATAGIIVKFLKEFGNFQRSGTKVVPNLDKSPFFNPLFPFQIL